MRFGIKPRRADEYTDRYLVYSSFESEAKVMMRIFTTVPSFAVVIRWCQELSLCNYPTLRRQVWASLSRPRHVPFYMARGAPGPGLPPPSLHQQLIKELPA